MCPALEPSTGLCGLALLAVVGPRLSWPEPAEAGDDADPDDAPESTQPARMWFKCSDSTVEPVSEFDVLEAEAYMLYVHGGGWLRWAC
jgi:hypothetical protein